MSMSGQDGSYIENLKKWDLRFLRLAREVASWSKDPSTKTGAVIATSEKSVLSVGFNGFPQGMSDDPTLYLDRDEKLSRIVHCEVNAVLFARGPIPPNSVLYTWPFMSCDRCVVQMLQAGIRSFVTVKPDPERAERWKDAFTRTRRYVLECQGELVEYDIEEVQ